MKADCKKCKYCSVKRSTSWLGKLKAIITVSQNYHSAKCLHEESMKSKDADFDIVKNEPVGLSLYFHCSTMRKYGDLCGLGGKYFEPIEEEGTEK